jgi:hypothetical protein
MSREHAHPWRWLSRNWFILLVASFAIGLALGQLWFHRNVNPGPVVSAVVSVASFAALVVFVVVLAEASSRLPACTATSGIVG